MTEQEFEKFKPKLIAEAKRLIKNDGYVNIVALFLEVTKNGAETVFYRSLSAILISDGKYIREPIFNKDNQLEGYHILKNPNYQLATIQKLTIILSLGVAIFTACVNWSNYKLANKNAVKSDLLRKQAQDLKSLQQEVQSIELQLKKRDTTKNLKTF